MSTEATIIADSISPSGQRLTTFQLRYQRFIHAEAKTHRIIEIDGTVYEEMVDMGLMDEAAFSRNASSSRAIPVKKMIEDLRRDPAMPVFWGSNQPGMQAGAELTGNDLTAAKRIWLLEMESAIRSAEHLIELGLHKQIANRILEPWAHINVVVTATDFENFFALRCHPDAQPEIKVLADMMRAAMAESTPKKLQPGEWHLPYITAEDREQITEITNWGNPHAADALYLDYIRKVSVARCARVSYLTHDGRQTTVQEDLALYERLVGGMPLHASPAEHQATPDDATYGASIPGVTRDYQLKGFKHPEEHGNLRGWRQLRKMLPGEFTPG